MATLAAMPPDTATATVDFVCPSRATCGDWAAGSYVFNASVNGVRQSTQGATYNFARRSSLRILVRPVKSNFAGTITQVRGNAWKTAWNFTRKVYPIGADQILWEIREDFDASGPMFDLETDDGRARSKARSSPGRPMSPEPSAPVVKSSSPAWPKVRTTSP